MFYVSEFLRRDFSAAVLVERPERRPQTLLFVVTLHALSQQVTKLAELDLTALCSNPSSSSSTSTSSSTSSSFSSSSPLMLMFFIL